MIVDLSAIYLDILKDRLYIYAPDSLERRSAQTILYELLTSLTKILAPILSFTTEEIWDYVKQFDKNAKESIHLEEMPLQNVNYIDKELEEVYKKLLKIRNEVLKGLEEARKKDIIRHPYEAKVILKLPSDYRNLVESRIDWIKFFFTVSQVEVVDEIDTSILDVVLKSEEIEGLIVGVKHAEGEKCPRCWIYDLSVGKNGQPVCDRCFEQLQKMNIKISNIEETK
jgi:isoleucyl-tRNA synthetase